MRAQSPPVHTAHPWLIDESSYRREVDNLRRVVRRERSTAQRQQSRGADGGFWVELKWNQHHNMLITSLKKHRKGSKFSSKHPDLKPVNLCISATFDWQWKSTTTTSSQMFFVVYSGDLLQRLHLISSRYMLLAQMLTTVCRSSPHVGNIYTQSRLNKSVATEM